MEPCENRKGQLADFTEIGLSEQNSPYICVLLRGTWKWEPLKRISGKTFQNVREQMYKSVHNCLQTRMQGEKDYGIMISGCKGSAKDIINGRWNAKSQLIKENEYNVYSNMSDKRLYCIHKLEGNVIKYQWWIGITAHMDIRRGFGWFRQKVFTTNSVPPWQVNKWLYWNKPLQTAGKWTEENTLKIERIDKEWEIQKAITDRTKQLTKDTEEIISSCNEVMNSTTEMVKKHKEVSRELFNKLTKEERLAVVDTSKFRAIFKKKDLCSCCFSDSETTKCIHQDCTGACTRCRSKGGGSEDTDCCACGKKQVLECPVCLKNDLPVSFMKIFGCNHGVCYKCYSRAYEVKRELKKCPMCRVAI